MRKATVVSLVAVFVLGVATLSLAGETKAVQKGSSHRIVGEVVTVDTTANSFTVKETVKGGGEAKEITFNMGDKAKVMVHGKPANLQDLKVGDSVTVRYIEQDGRNIAEECNVAKPATAKASH